MIIASALNSNFTFDTGSGQTRREQLEDLLELVWYKKCTLEEIVTWKEYTLGTFDNAGPTLAIPSRYFEDKVGSSNLQTTEEQKGKCEEFESFPHRRIIYDGRFYIL